jgi:hypothetical protein
MTKYQVTRTLKYEFRLQKNIFLLQKAIRLFLLTIAGIRTANWSAAKGVVDVIKDIPIFWYVSRELGASPPSGVVYRITPVSKTN